MIVLKLAGLPIAVDNKYPFIEKLARGYFTDSEPLFTVSATDDEIRIEGENSECECSPGYLESIVIYRKIAEQLPKYDAFVFHGAVLSFEGEAYAFTAKSGVGKTTHTRHWLSALGEKVHYLNGDKPIFRFINDTLYACGTPYRGKEGYGVNEIAPLRAIAFVNRAKENFAIKTEADSAALKLASQVYMPSDPESAIRTLQLIDRLAHCVRLVELFCNPEPDAAHVSFKAMVLD